MKNGPVSVLFRASSVSRTESSPVRFVHVPGWNWACQIGRVSQFVGGPAAAGVSLLGLDWCGCWALSCGVVPLPLVGAC